MHCPRCGEANEDSDRFCSSCGQDLSAYRQLWKGRDPTPGAPTGPGAHLGQDTAPAAEIPRVPSYLGWSAALLACCWPAFPAGIVAVVYSGRTESRLAAGDTAGARVASQKARTWCWVTFWAGLALWVTAVALLISLSR